MCVTHWFTFHRITFTLIKLKIKSHSFFYFFFFLLLTFDGGGGFFELIDSLKIEEARFFSLTPLTLFFLSLSLSLSLTLSHSHKLINLFYFTLTLFTLVINSIELIWTSPFQKYSLNLSHSAQVMSHISHSLSHSLVIELMCHMTWAFFLSLFSITSWACEWSHHHKQWVSEWELIIEP